MIPRIVLITTLLAAVAGWPAAAQQSGVTVTPAFRHEIPNVPGKSMVAVVVTYAPGAKSPPHRHAASAFITRICAVGRGAQPGRR